MEMKKKEIILVGKDPEEMREMASKMIGIEKEKLQQEILEKKSGMLNFLTGNKYRIRYYCEKSNSPLTIAEKMLHLMNIDAKVTSEEKDGYVYIRIFSKKDESLLIGKEGKVINSLEHLIGRISCNGESDEMKGVILDVGNYRKRREKMLEKTANTIASKVCSQQKEKMTRPLLASERRIIHKTLQFNEKIKTYTVGRGTHKRVVISLKEAKGSTNR
jgi:spoIIIJ-associated protein